MTNAAPNTSIEVSSPRLLPGLLLAATLSADAAVVTWHRYEGTRLVLSWSEVLLYALAFSQVSAVAVWLAWGRSALFLRTMLALLCIAAWTLLSANKGADEAVFFFLLTVLIAGAGLLARWLGLTLLYANATPIKRPASGQFTIGQIMLCTTALAVILAAVRWFEISLVATTSLGELLQYGLILAAAALLVAWMVFTGRSRWWSAGLAVLGTAAVGGLVNWDSTPISIHDVQVSAIFGGHAVLLVLTLKVFRLAGYRFQFKSKPVA